MSAPQGVCLLGLFVQETQVLLRFMFSFRLSFLSDIDDVCANRTKFRVNFASLPNSLGLDDLAKIVSCGFYTDFKQSISCLSCETFLAVLHGRGRLCACS